MRGRANWDACGDERMYMSAPSPSTCRLYILGRPHRSSPPPPAARPSPLPPPHGRACRPCDSAHRRPTCAARGSDELCAARPTGNGRSELNEKGSGARSGPVPVTSATVFVSLICITSNSATGRSDDSPTLRHGVVGQKSKEGEEGWQRRLTYIVVISERPHKFDECCQFQIIHGFPMPKLLLYTPFDCILTHFTRHST
ncbi:hypothetical protein VPH35_068023 [Triticum aestivum]